jgi:hypothetical protein
LETARSIGWAVQPSVPKLRICELTAPPGPRLIALGAGRVSGAVSRAPLGGTKMADLIAVVFPTEQKAEEVRDKILAMQKDYLIEIGDAVIAT